MAFWDIERVNREVWLLKQRIQVLEELLGSSDDWGTQVVEHDTSLIGDGTVGNELGVSGKDSATIDITGLTDLDCLLINSNVGEFNITSSNANETLNTITNAPVLFPIALRPASGLLLSLNNTSYIGILPGQLSINSSSVDLDGTTSDYIILEIDPAGTGCLIERERRVNANPLFKAGESELSSFLLMGA